MAEIARTLRELYDPEHGGTAFAIDGLVEPDVMEKWLKLGVLGQTSNQTLFLEKVKAGQLDLEIQALHKDGKSAAEIFNLLYNLEAKTSADALSKWVDPQHSLAFSRETDATRAADGAAIVEEAQSIQAISPWIFVKLANVGPSPEAIRMMIRDAILRGASSGQLLHPNITLVFGAHHYVNTVAGYIEGLEAAAEKGIDIRAVRSVNSLFVSRLDTAVDERIEKRISATSDNKEQHLLKHLLGKTAIANGKKVYQMSRSIFLDEDFDDPMGLFGELPDAVADLRKRFKKLKDAQMQRLLIASSGNKKPGIYSDLIYVLPFLGPYLANTLPVKTLAVLEQYLSTKGIPKRDTVFDPLPWMIQTKETIPDWERAVLEGGGASTKTPDEILQLVTEQVLKPANTSLTAITDELRDKGAKAFANDQEQAYAVFEGKVKSLGEN